MQDWNRDRFSVTAVDGAAHELGLGAKIVMSRQTSLALPARDLGVDQHPVSHAKAAHF